MVRTSFFVTFTKSLNSTRSSLRYERRRGVNVSMVDSLPASYHIQEGKGNGRKAERLHALDQSFKSASQKQLVSNTPLGAIRPAGGHRTGRSFLASDDASWV